MSAPGRHRNLRPAFRRCINCSLALNPRLSRCVIEELDDQLVTLLQAWVLPTELSPDNLICIPCYLLLQKQLSNAYDDSVKVSPLYGHNDVCFGCGITVRGARTHKVPLDCMERDVILRWTPAHQVKRLEKICVACWRVANREVQKIQDQNKHTDCEIDTNQPQNCSTKTDTDSSFNENLVPKIESDLEHSLDSPTSEIPLRDCKDCHNNDETDSTDFHDSHNNYERDHDYTKNSHIKIEIDSNNTPESSDSECCISNIENTEVDSNDRNTLTNIEKTPTTSQKRPITVRIPSSDSEDGEVWEPSSVKRQSAVPREPVEPLPKISSLIYKRVASTSSRCIIRGCNSKQRNTVPSNLKEVLLLRHNIYVPSTARICKAHMKYKEWDKLKAKYTDLTEHQVDDIFSILQRAVHRPFDFSNIDSMEPNMCLYWLGLTAQQFRDLLASIPSLRTKVKNPNLALSMYLVKQRSGDTNARLATLFNITRSTLEAKIGIVKDCLSSASNAV